MMLLPTENITYKTRLKEEEIIKRLSDIIEPEKPIRFSFFYSGSIKSYQGQISGQTFDITRIIRYRNSFLPRIKGVIEKDYDAIRIKVKMRLHILVIVFLCFWCGAFGPISINVLAQSFRNSQFNPENLIPVGMLLFVYGMTMAGFKFESNKSKKDLQKIFQADIIKE